MHTQSAVQPAYLLEGRALECVKGDEILWHNVNFQVNCGQALQLIGANGAGKTSLLKIIAGLNVPESGELRWQGALLPTVIDEYHSVLRYIGHQPGFSHALTVLQNLRFHAALLAAPNTTDLIGVLDGMDLSAQAHTPCAFLSQGQKQRLALCRLLLAESQVWLLDEPANALDRSATMQLQSHLDRHLKNRGIVVFTSHQPLQIEANALLTLDLDRRRTTPTTERG